MFYSKEFKKLRLLRKMSRETVANSIGKSIKTIQRWESGMTEPSEFFIRLLADLISVHVSEISNFHEKEKLVPIFYEKLSTLDKSNYDISRKSDSEKQKIYIELHKKLDLLLWEKKQLSKSSTEYKSILSNLDCMVYKKDNKLRYNYINDKFISFFNILDKTLILGHRNNEIWKSHKSWGNLKELETKVLSTGKEVIGTEIPLPLSFGPEGVGILSLKPLLDSKGKPVELIGLIVDVSGENAIKEKFSYMESVLDKMEEIIWIIKKDPYRHYMYINKAVEEVYKEHKSDFYRSVDKWQEFIHPDDRDRVLKEYRSGADELLYRIALKDEQASVKWVKQNFYFSEVNGKKVEFGAINDVSDIIEWKREKNFLYSVIDNIPGSFVWKAQQDNKKGISFNYISSNIQFILGYDHKFFTVLKNSFFEFVHPDQKAIVERTLKNTDSNYDELELMLKCNSNKYKWFLIKIKRKRINSKTINNYGIATDISDKKEIAKLNEESKEWKENEI
ncbi:MAG: PAS domain-containing protein [bacterium]|nr:PAS domain-containing protein [bacterium]